MHPKIILDYNPRIIALIQKIGIFGVVGFERFQNLILAYDHDIDLRLRQAVDSVGPYFKHDLILAHEQDGTLSLLWRNEVPQPFQVGQSIATTYDDGAIDHWQIGFSKAAKHIEDEFKNKFWLGNFNPN